MDLKLINNQLRNSSPHEIIKWALNIAERPIVTTNFRPYAQSILFAVTQVQKDIPVIWVDSGYNTSFTYKHALETIERFKLNIDVFVPKTTVAFRDVTLGTPQPDTDDHDEFTREVKLEPFERAMKKYQPDVWFANLRKGQTAFRDSLDIVNLTKDGVLKVCPFYYCSDEELEAYMKTHGLESEERYFDPTKAFSNRECGLHIN